MNYKDLNDVELIEVLEDWIASASNSWNSFHSNEKIFFRQLQDEACKRFIEEHKKELNYET